MAKDRKKLLHIHSSIPDKQPTPQSLEVGEIAVNNAENQEFISLKNSNNKVVRFSSDEQLITWTEKKEVIPYSGTVDNVHLDTNRSNIEIKLNQVVAHNTVKNDVVNGALDIDNNPVNPSSDGGLTNGAGFAIDMSRYAMIGANPSFSGITNTCYTNLNGTTKIKGTTGDCGSLLDITVNSARTDVETASTRITSATTVIGTNTTTISGNTTLNVSGTTTEVKVGNVTENNQSDYRVNTSGDTIMLTTGNTAIHSDGSLGISASGDVTIISAENDIFITADKEICETSGVKASFKAPITNIGLACDESLSASTTNLFGYFMHLKSNTFSGDIEDNSTVKIGGDSVTIVTGSTTIESVGTNSDVCISATDMAAFRGGNTTNIGKNCTNTLQTGTLNLNCDEINETGNTVNISGTSSVNVSSSTINLSGSTLTGKFGNINLSGTTKISGNTEIGGNLTVDGESTLVGPVHLTNGLNKSLYWEYGNVCDKINGSTNFAESSDNPSRTITIPKTLSDVSCGHVSDTDVSSTSDGCINFTKPLCVTGTITASGAIYSSDRNLKENINFVQREDFNKAKNVPIKSFNFKDDENKNKIYGVIAQETQEAGLGELVYTKEDGHLAVDYTSLMMLKIAYLEDFCAHLNGKIAYLENKINELKNI
jgi:hypothetical protein